MSKGNRLAYSTSSLWPQMGDLASQEHLSFGENVLGVLSWVAGLKRARGVSCCQQSLTKLDSRPNSSC